MSERGGDSGLVRIRLLYGLLGGAEAAWTPFMALYLRERGFDAGEIGATLAAMALASFVSGPGWGYAADSRLGHERTLTLIAGGGVPLALAVALAPGKASVAVACVVLWAWKAPQFGIADAIALARLGGRRAGYGAIRLWFSIGFAAGALACGALLQVGSARLSPVAYAAMLAIAAVVSSRLKRTHAAAPAEEPLPTPGRAGRRGSLVALSSFLASLLLLQAAFFAAQNFLALRIVDLGGGAALVGVARALQAGAEVPVMAWTSGRRNRRLPIELFAFACLLWGAVFTGWALVSNPYAATAINLAAGVAYALTAVSTVVIVDELVPLRYRATGQTAARALGSGLAPVAGNVGGGLVYGALGSGAMFGATAGAAGLAAVAAGVAVSRARRVRSDGGAGLEVEEAELLRHDR